FPDPHARGYRDCSQHSRRTVERYGASSACIPLGGRVIAALSGRLRLRDSGRVILETAGVGYEVFIPLSTYYRLPPIGESVDLEIRQVVREDSITLYGFAGAGEKRAFDLLMGGRTCGPTVAWALFPRA